MCVYILLVSHDVEECLLHFTIRSHL